MKGVTEMAKAQDNFVKRKRGSTRDVETGESFRLANIQSIEKNKPWNYWYDMPEFKYRGLELFKKVRIDFTSQEDLDYFIQLTGLPITEKTRFLNIPEKPQFNAKNFGYVTDEPIQPQYPIYIVSKGRYEKRPTSDYLCKMKVKHNIIVEPQEVEEYKARVDSQWVTIVPLDMSYKEKYFIGWEGNKTGPGPARNYAIDLAKQDGYKFGWTMDDNISSFMRYGSDQKRYVYTGACIKALEDHVNRFSNVLMAGPAYSWFTKAHYANLPFLTNCRIYSCTLTRVDMAECLEEITEKIYGIKKYPYWQALRGNEDTECSLRVLKAGYCTIQYQFFLQDKMATQALKGGNTTEFYENDEGTRAKTDVLVKWFPKDTEVKIKFSRYHHSVDYNPYKPNQLKLKPEYQDTFGKEKVNNYGMKYIRMATGEIVQENYDGEV